MPTAQDVNGQANTARANWATLFTVFAALPVAGRSISISTTCVQHVDVGRKAATGVSALA